MVRARSPCKPSQPVSTAQFNLYPLFLSLVLCIPHLQAFTLSYSLPLCCPFSSSFTTHRIYSLDSYRAITEGRFHRIKASGA
jgi:hypothetical protein